MDFLETILSSPICSDSPAAIISKAEMPGDISEIQRTQQAYLESGARLIHTTSPFATPSRLIPDETHGANEINWQAAQLARQSVQSHRNAWVAGLIATPDEALSASLAADLREQMGALLDGGVQLIHLFGFARLSDLETAITVKHELHHCPVIATLRVNPATMELADGVPLFDAVKNLTELEADIIGATPASEPCLGLLREAASDTPLLIEMNAETTLEEVSRQANSGARIFACPSPASVVALAAAWRRAEEKN